MLSTASIADGKNTTFSIPDMHPSTFHHMMAPPSAPQWFTSQSRTATIPPGFTPALQHPPFHQQQQAGFGPTQFVQPMASGPQPHIPNSQWMTGPASTQAAAIFAPQGHTMHQPPMQGHYDAPAPMQLRHSASTSHHGHLIPPQAPPQQLQPLQPQPTAFMPTQTPHAPASATVLNHTPTYAFISQQQQQHQPPPPQQQPPAQANFTLPTTLTPTMAAPQPCTTPMQTASPAPVSATTPQQPPTTPQQPQQPQPQANLPPRPAQLQQLHLLPQQGTHLLPSQLIQTNVVRCRVAQLLSRHGRPRSLPQREDRQSRWHYRADQGIQAPPSYPRRPPGIPKPPAATGGNSPHPHFIFRIKCGK